MLGAPIWAVVTVLRPVIVVINAIVGFIQESKAEAALESLRSMVQTQAKVVRDGHEHTMPSEELVPGDLVLLEAGPEWYSERDSAMLTMMDPENTGPMIT